MAVDTDKRRLDISLIHEFLTHSYWARGIPRAVVEASIGNSLCFGLYEGARQVGFARVVTDSATFAYLADVFIIESHRGRLWATNNQGAGACLHFWLPAPSPASA